MTSYQQLIRCVRYTLPHLALLAAVIIYVLLGAGTFYAIEHPNEIEKKRTALRLTNEHIEKMAFELHRSCFKQDESLPMWKPRFRSFILNFIKVWEDVSEIAFVAPEDLYGNGTKFLTEKWSFSSAVLFSFTTSTTIGYGNIFPATTTGRAICVIYALIGIPLTLITVANLGKFFAAAIYLLVRKITRGVKKLKKPNGPRRVRHIDGEPSEHYESLQENNALSCAIILVLLLGYMFLGALCFSLLEVPNFFESFFMVFVAVFTIGIGEFDPNGYYFVFVFMVYIIFGLILMSLLLGVVHVIVKKVHYRGQRPINVRDVTIWFGSERLTAGNLTVAIAKQAGIKQEAIDLLIDDLDRVIANAIADRDGRQPAAVSMNLAKTHPQKYGILFSIANESIPYMDEKPTTPLLNKGPQPVNL